MYTKKNKEIVLLTYMLLLTISLSLSSNNFLAIWFSMEMNLIAFVPILSGCKSTQETESTIKYFLIQSISSSTFLFSCIMSLYLTPSLLINFIMISSIMMKLGAAPLFSWFPSVMKTVSWKNLFFSAVVQKMIPLYMIVMIKMSSTTLMYITLTNVLVGTLGGFSQYSLKKILAFSSISHMSWIFSSIKMNFMTFALYFMFYMMIMMELTFFFNKMSLSYLTDMTTKINSSVLYLIMSFKMFSLMGLPPFLGFYPKIMCTYIMMKEKFIWMPLIMIFLGMISIFIYIRTILSSLIMNTSSLKISKESYSLKKTSWSFLIYTEAMTLFLSLMFFIMCTY